MHPSLSPIFATVPLLAVMHHTVIASHDAIGDVGDAAAGWFGLHFTASQVPLPQVYCHSYRNYCSSMIGAVLQAILFALRSCRFQHETASCQRIPRASGWALVQDACIFGLLKMVMISSLQLP